jgi:5-methylcytosine-specific restriction enzyme A
MRTEFSATIRQQAWKRSNGRCEHPGCGIKIQVGKFHFDHIQPDGLGGKPVLENCQVLCLFHHEEKTTQHDNPIMTKADNQRKAHLGLKPKGRGFPKPPPGYNAWTRRVET